MAREVLTLKDIRKINESGESARLASDLTVPAGRDGYIDRLFKYIPSELVAGYIFILGLLNKLTATGEIRVFQWSVFVIFCLLTPLYLYRVQKVKKISQQIISLLSFIVWAFALGGPFALYDWYNPVYGDIILPLFTLGIALWEAE